MMYQSLQQELALAKAHTRELDHQLLLWKSCMKGDGTFYTLFDACKEGRTPIIDFLVKNGADLQKTENGMTVLMLAARNNRLEATQYLCTRGLDVDGLGRLTPAEEEQSTGIYFVHSQCALFLVFGSSQI
jgi:ankyrin repeat protein